MKKALVFVLLSFAAVGITYAQNAGKQLKAYQEPLIPIKLDTSITSLLNNSKQTEKFNTDWTTANQLSTSQAYTSNMPIANHSVQNLDIMPIAKLGVKNTRYTMMIKRVSYAKGTVSKALREPLPDTEKEK
ncbi:hypothetical protein [Mucilaginibacter terrae]|uniref:Bisphosphoglycerate-dependent phosphoglycerate mutase n=1 Tax=Mucilaginibacter terrae TaxID=1955052 RepID=A0ABU3GUP2_9SPHI|nr:hypothetical protein [Mucilaginibacter terrae]MDT3403301.1 bisphosphoglycerate-dependent phosphoglycerate mutase [Mucilaginibacter terrae]